MMTKNEKKELFLLILENCFEDTTEEINKNNCISFYHFFIDYLQFEARFNSKELFGLNSFIVAIIEILTNLETYANKYIFNRDNFLTIIQYLSGISSNETMETCMSEVNSIYHMSKEEFFL